MKHIYLLSTVFSAALLMAPSAMSADNGNQVFYESFNKLQDKGGNDGYFGNIDYADGRTDSITVANTDLITTENLDNTEGWTLNSVAQGDQCVRVSTKKKGGDITTPAFALNGNDATLTFCAAAQAGDNVTLYVELVGDGSLTYDKVTDKKIAIQLPQTINRDGDVVTTVLSDQVYHVAISGVSASTQVKFSTISSKTDKQRVWLDEIRVVTGQATGVNFVKQSHKKSTETYNLMGQRIGNNVRGLVIVGGKKVVR